MIRLAEIVLLLLPLAAFIGWRVLAPGRSVPIGAIVGAGVVLALLAAVLIWERQREAAPPDAVYIPRHIENGRIVP
jgi:protein-S-isoprenylcysteine O-methyltransferase Ste14